MEPSRSRSSPTPWDAHLVDGFIAGVLQPQVNHGVLQRPPHVKLQGEVVNPLKEKTTPWSPSPGLEEAPLDPRSRHRALSRSKRKNPDSQESRVVCTWNLKAGAPRRWLCPAAPALLSCHCYFPSREEGSTEAVLFGQAPAPCLRTGTAPGWSPRACQQHKVKL